MAAYLILVEGESDCWTLWHHGYPALGIPGSSNVKCLAAEHVAGFDRIVIVSEPDVAGQKFPAALSARLREIGFAGRIETLFMGPSGFKDPSALYLDDPPGFREKFDALLKEAARTVETPPTVAGPYEIHKDGSTIFRKAIKSGRTEVFVEEVLANFNARIIEDVLKDDGLSQERILTLRVQVDGKSPQTVEIPAAQFPAMNWVARLRGGAVISAGMGIRDRLREAIERLSGQMLERTIYTHTGWREIDGDWVYLHGGGGIAADGLRGDIQAELPPSLSDFRLPVPPEGAELRECLRTSAGLLEAGRARAELVALFAAIWRAALAEADFSVFLVGETGTYKSSLAAVAQRHFGAGFDRERLPGNWASTVNFNENLAFRAKDALLVIDDFRPATHGLDKSLQQAAERLFRAQGNRQGRGRLAADANEKPTRAPRGMILATAEEFVWGSSLEARMVVLEVARGDLDLDRLIALHQAGETGVLSAAMAGWIKWLAPRLTEIRKRIARQAAEVARGFNAHPRTALALAELQATLEVWQEFSGIKIPDCDALFFEKAKKQGKEARANQNPVSRFFDLYAQALLAGRTHARTLHGTKPATGVWGWATDKTGTYTPQGPCSLYIDEEKDRYLLAIDVAHSVVYHMAVDGTRPSVGVRMLTKLIADQGCLASNGHDFGFESYKVRVIMDRTQVYLLDIKPDMLVAS
jgi:hypothetical protein